MVAPITAIPSNTAFGWDSVPESCDNKTESRYRAFMSKTRAVHVRAFTMFVIRRRWYEVGGTSVVM